MPLFVAQARDREAIFNAKRAASKARADTIRAMRKMRLHRTQEEHAVQSPKTTVQAEVEVGSITFPAASSASAQDQVLVRIIHIREQDPIVQADALEDVAQEQQVYSNEQLLLVVETLRRLVVLSGNSIEMDQIKKEWQGSSTQAT